VILYLDTSALVKLYVEESGSGTVAAAVEEAAAVATARITYAEARAALARHTRAGGLTREEHRRVIRQLDEEWGQYTLVEITDTLVRRAGTLAERHGLCAYDAVQLAAALDLRLPGTDVAFASFDDRLNRAARRERLRPLPGGSRR
jgi:predicted nucleic acid-binding protein